ncbi:uncharacterized protein BYT42DRAFT_254136 [Radiomyces spectabilis]|uniref:uncharacterized protein n=1 Tax=Radiomyces spectabilis TaxID=64574 RepID=UPI00221F796B|nr:uncharacterized protein BYT42DRAFT_254136 [Radiomyces spectabilis]KAI8384241.1 hypothetical protein BYT42DRAFT_254136 [Radiomyces spectabilis]
MSSSTITDPYITETWIHMQHQAHGSQQARKTHDLADKFNAARRSSRPSIDTGRFARSTASSRSRSGKTTNPTATEDEVGMTRDGIFEAFAQVEKNLSSNSTKEGADVVKKSAPASRKMSLAENDAPPKHAPTITMRRKSLGTNAYDAAAKSQPSQRRSRAAVADGPESSSPRTITATTRARANTLASIQLRRGSFTTAQTVADSPSASPRVRALKTKPPNDDNLTGRAATLKASLARRRVSSGAVLVSEQSSNPSSTMPSEPLHSGKEPCTDATVTTQHQDDDLACETSDKDTRARQGSIVTHTKSNVPPSIVYPPSANDASSPRLAAKSAHSSVKSTSRVEPPEGEGGSGGGGFIRLADALRDSLAVERKLAKKELGLYPEKTSNVSPRIKPTLLSSPPSPPVATEHSSIKPPPSSVRSAKMTAILDSPRRKSLHQNGSSAESPKRSSVVEDTPRTLKPKPTDTKAAVPRTPRRRTLSSGATLKPAIETVRTERRKSAVVGALAITPTKPSYMRSTIGEQRRHSNLCSPPSPLRQTGSPKWRHSRDEPTVSSPLAAERDREEIRSPGNSKRRSVLSNHGKSKTNALSRASSSSSSTYGGLGSSEEDAKQTQQRRRRTVSKPCLADFGHSPSKTPNADSSVAPTRSRKKSVTMVDEDGGFYNLAGRRMSRTESLKEGVPTAPSVNAAILVRKKSLGGGDPMNIKRMSKPKPVGSDEAQTKKSVTVRKRGKTLPGNLAKPPVVKSLHLPPMKVEPIRLTLPKSSTGKGVPKSPSTRSMAVAPAVKKKFL